MSEQLTFLLFLAALSYGFYKAYRKKREKLFYALILVAFTMLHRYPFYLPIEIVFAFWAFLGFGVLLYKWKVKKGDDTLIVFSIMFLTLGLVSLIQAIYHANALDPVLAQFFSK